MLSIKERVRGAALAATLFGTTMFGSQGEVRPTNSPIKKNNQPEVSQVVGTQRVSQAADGLRGLVDGMITYAAELVEQPKNIIFIPESADVVRSTPQGTVIEKRLVRGNLLLAAGQKVTAGGRVYDAHSEVDPERTTGTVFSSEGDIGQFKVQLGTGTNAWIAAERVEGKKDKKGKTRRPTREERDLAAKKALEKLVFDLQNPANSNCLGTGCPRVDGEALAVRQRPDGQLVFRSIVPQRLFVRK